MADTTAGTTHNPAGDGAKPAKRRRWRKRTLMTLGVIFVVLVVLLLLTPTLLSTATGRGIVVSQINGRIPGKVNIDALSLGWFSGQRIGGLTLLDADGKVVLQIKAIDAPEAGLWSVVRGNMHLGPVTVTEPVGNIEQYADGTTNLTRAIKAVKAPGAASASTASAGKQSVPAGLRVKLDLTGGNLTYTGPGIEPVKLTGLMAVADLLDPQHIQISTQCDITQGTGTGKLDVKSTINNLIAPNGAIQEADASVDTAVSLTNVPVAMVDRLLKRDGELVGLLGNTATVTVNGNIAQSGQSPVNIALSSENTKANIAAIIDGGLKGTLRLHDDTIVTLTITPELSKAFLTKVTGWVNPASGDRPITLTVKHDTFAMPLGDLNLKKIVCDATLDMGTVNMQPNDPVVGAAFTGVSLLEAAGQGNTSNLLSLGESALSSIGKNTKNTPAQSVTFTPMTLHLENGVATYNNLDMTLQQLTFAFKGDVNLDTKANNLTMSILGQSIATAFPKWKGSFGPGNDLTIQIGGTYDDPKPDLKGLASEVLKLAGNGKGKSNPTDQVLQGLGGLFGKKNK